MELVNLEQKNDEIPIIHLKMCIHKVLRIILAFKKL
jgi:hypothetical protein